MQRALIVKNLPLLDLLNDRQNSQSKKNINVEITPDEFGDVYDEFVPSTYSKYLRELERHNEQKYNLSNEELLKLPRILNKIDLKENKTKQEIEIIDTELKYIKKINKRANSDIEELNLLYLRRKFIQDYPFEFSKLTPLDKDELKLLIDTATKKVKNESQLEKNQIVPNYINFQEKFEYKIIKPLVDIPEYFKTITQKAEIRQTFFELNKELELPLEHIHTEIAKEKSRYNSYDKQIENYTDKEIRLLFDEDPNIVKYDLVASEHLDLYKKLIEINPENIINCVPKGLNVSFSFEVTEQNDLVSEINQFFIKKHPSVKFPIPDIEEIETHYDLIWNFLLQKEPNLKNEFRFASDLDKLKTEFVYEWLMEEGRDTFTIEDPLEYFKMNKNSFFKKLENLINYENGQILFNDENETPLLNALIKALNDYVHPEYNSQCLTNHLKMQHQLKMKKDLDKLNQYTKTDEVIIEKKVKNNIRI